MRIAFDIDDTLIPSSRDMFAVEEPSGLFRRWLARERFRVGAGRLLRALRFKSLTYLIVRNAVLFAV